MVSKNNRVKRMEAAAERKQHHGIRKMSVGAVSVLLGTTLWISIPTSTVHADEANNQPKADLESGETASTGHVEKVIVEQNQSSGESAQQDTTETNDVSAQNDQESIDGSSVSTESAQEYSVDTKIDTNDVTSEVQVETPKITETEQSADVKEEISSDKSSANSVDNNVNSETSNANTNNSTLANTQTGLTDSNVQLNESTPSIDQVGQEGKTDIKLDDNNSSELKIGDLSSNLSDEALKANLIQGNQILLSQSSSNEVVAGKTADPTKELEAMARTATLANTNEADNYTTVKNYSDLQRAVSNYRVSGVNIDGNINVYGNLTINRAFTIKGLNNATLNLNQNALVNNATLTLEDITVNGSIMGSGTVNIKGEVTSNVNDANGYILTNSEKTPPGVKVNWTQTKGHNIQSSAVNVDENASLTVNRSSVGDGIHLVSNGIVNVGDYGQLTINTNTSNDLTIVARYHDAGIFAESNGSLTTGYKSVVTLNTSIGQGIAMAGVRPNVTDSERFGGYERDRLNGSGQINLGQYSTMNFTGRDGVILGNNSNFNVGEYANVHFENKGRGVALDLANNSNINIAAHAVTYFHSVGKNTTNAAGNIVGPSGSYDGYNYIGVNEAGNITIGEDATFRVIMENRGDNAWDDVVSLDSQLATTNAAFTSKKGAIVDIRDDNTNFYAELISFPLGTANSRIDIQDPLLLNLQRYSAGGATTGWMAGVGGVSINTTSEKYTANLIYMGGTKGVLSIGGTNYVVYQQIKSDGTQQIWTDVNSVEFHKSGFASQDIFNNGANPDVSINGNGLTSGIRANQIRDNQTDPTLVNLQNSPAYGISTMRASHQIWIPHETATQVKGTHTNTIRYVYEDGTPVLGEDGQPLVVTQNLNLTRDLSLDLTPDQIRTIQDYALGHTADETLNYIRSGYSVTQDSGWKFINDQGQTVTDPYVSVTSPVKEGYTVTVQSTNAPGVIMGADGKTVKANFTLDPASDVVQNGQLSEGYRLHGTTGIPEDYQTVVVYKKVEKGSVQVIFHDDTTNTIIPNVGYDSGTEETGKQVTYTTTQNISDLEKQGYVYVSTDGTIPTTIPNNAATITVHMKHGTAPVNPDNPTDKYTREDLQKTVTRTINYVDTAGNKIADSTTSTVVFTGSGTVDKVTGNLVNVDAGGNIVDQNGELTWTYAVDGGATQNGNSYTFLETSAKPSIEHNGSTYNYVSVTPANYGAGSGAVTSYGVNIHNPHDLTVDVVYSESASYHVGKTETKEVTRTINYLDGKTGEKIPTNLILDNPIDQTVSMYRTEILDSTGKVIGYGTVSPDGKTYTLNTGWIVDGDWASVASPDLTTSGYEAPRFEDNSAAATVAGQTVTADTGNTVINVYYDHQMIPVGPDTPDKHGVDPSEVEKTVKETVHYIGAGDNTPDDQVQTSKWTRTVTVDAVTNEIVPNGKHTTDWTIPNGEKEEYAQVNTPVVEGYYADQANVPATPVTQDDLEVTVTYKPVGKVIPVDPDGNPIPGIDTPQFPNDPNDPTKVTPGEKPYVPNYHPETGKPGDQVDPDPNNPGEDVKVPYAPDTPVVDQKALVNYIDADDGNKVITSSGDLTGKAGEKIDYTTKTTITELENKGYILVHDNFPAEAAFDNDDGTTQVFTVVLRHDTQTVTPTDPGKPGEPINPNDPDGPKWPDETGKDSLSKTGTQTVHYIGAGDKTPEDNVQNFEFTRTAVVDKVTGKIISTTGWNVTSHTFGDVDTPVVDGYHADKRTAGGATITPDDLNKTVVVTYASNGKIIPVDPNGNPIPDAPTPQYPTDPNDPTRVVPNQPVPDIPGHTPSVPTVTPTDPGKDTPVPYTPEAPAADQKALVNYIDADDGNKVITTSGDLSGKSGEKIDYTTKSTIAELENKGYVLVHDGFPDGVTFDNDDENTQIYTVVLRHGTQTVTPDEPGKPGEPINPNDPDGPKWPDETGVDALKVTGTQTVHYIGAGDKTPEDNVQNFEFTKTAVVDKVTGKIISTTGWNVTSHTFGDVDTPVVDGYHADKRTAGGTTITPDDLNKTIVVKYSENGKIIPVDPDGKPIPNVSTPQYPTDPTDPTKVVPNQPVPDVPGHRPSVPTVTPTDPGKDTPVPYAPIQGSVRVLFHDDTINQLIPDVGYESGAQDEGTKVDYTTNQHINDLINKGYVYVGTDGNIPAEIIADQNITVTVHMKHGTTTITPDQPGKPGEPINPNDPDGPKWPSDTDTTGLTKQGSQTVHYVYADGSKAAEDNVQNVTFEHTLVFDNVTGKVLEDKGWTPENHKFNNVASPTIDGFHPDKTMVDGVTVTTDNPTSETTVVYAKNGQVIRDHQEIKASQIVKYVDDQGNELHKSDLQNFAFTYTGDAYDEVTGAKIQTGTWNATITDFTAADVPVITGYVAVSGYTNNDGKYTAGGFTTTRESSADQRNRVFTVVYKKVGNIVPVGPDGKTPIPDAPTPDYQNDPNDPTKVTPDEPVPSIPGYTPNVPTVTPGDPTKDTPVPYTPNIPIKDQNAVVNYIDSDDGDKVITSSGELTGKPGDKVDYSTGATIEELVNKGYVLVHDGFPDGATFDNDDNTTQTYMVVLKHGTTTVTPDKPGKPGEPINPNDPDGPKWPDETGKDSLTKTGTQTIHYQGAGDKTPKDDIQKFEFTRTAVVDKVTGKVISIGDWNVTDHTFGNVDTPVVDGYHADKRTAGGTTITPDDLNKTVTVNYTANGRIVPVDPAGKPIPNVPTPQYPTDPNDPTKVVPNQPVPDIPGHKPSVPTVTPTDPGKDTPVPYAPNTPTPVKDQKAIVNYIDSDDGNKVITSSGELTGKPGDKVNYSTADTIKDLVNKGYVLVTDGFPKDVIYDNDDNTTQTYTVVLKHDTTTVTPDKPGKPGEQINPNNPDGPKWPDETGKDSLTKTGTQTIHYQGAGDKTPKDDIQRFEFTRTAVVDKVTGKVISIGSWNVTSHTFGKVNTPVVNGYHADKRSAGGATITPDDLNKTVTVNYTANGKIVPVGPDGKPIPNVPTPQYPTDPNDPTKVVPNQPVPNVPGYRPSVPRVTPSDPGKDTPVPYTPQTTPVNPDRPTTPDRPVTPTTPTTPTTPDIPVPHPETPDEPSTPAPEPRGEKADVPTTPAPAPHGQKETAKVVHTSVKDKTISTSAPVVKEASASEAELPQTGEKDNNAAAILGATAGMIGLVGLSGVKKKKKRDEED